MPIGRKAGGTEWQRVASVRTIYIWLGIAFAISFIAGQTTTKSPSLAAALALGAVVVALSIVVWKQAAALELFRSRELRALRSAHSKERLLRQALDELDQGVVIEGVDKRVILANRAYWAMMGIPGNSSEWQSGFDHADRSVNGSAAGKGARRPPPGSMRPTHIEHAFPDGSILRVSTRSLSGGSLLQIFADVTNLRRAERRLLTLAEQDPVTGLLHQAAFQSELGRRVQQCSESLKCALLVFDIDNFRSINEQHGHETGDRLLRQTGQRLKRMVRSDDVVARIGANTFAVLWGGAISEPTMQLRAEQIGLALVARYNAGSCGIGISVTQAAVFVTCGSEKPAAILRRAYQALAVSKAARPVPAARSGLVLK